ncbi:MAG: amino acid decarboxylase, partial [Clostridia bacterium]|nr:amino acid decarboxylase [Clostridia bacterium]
MPGHKGCAQPLIEALGPALRWDVTELEATDSLYDASGPLLEAEKAAALLFGANETLISASGATLCIQAMLRLAG